MIKTRIEDSLYPQLIEKAREALSNAYCPYSGYKVGAAVLTVKGKIYTGCNIENAAYGPSICAERVAVFKAVSEGKRDFVRIAVAGSTKAFCAPCGVCRQVLQEFAPELEVILVNCDGETLELTQRELLPYSFGSENLSAE